VKTYLVKLAAVVVIMMVGHYVILFTIRTPIPAEYWVREFIVVKQYQAAAMPSPKLIFAGGSFTLFGIDAVEVQRSLGLPAINLGLHAGMRLEDHLAEVSLAAKPGDVVVLSLEPAYYNYYTYRWNGWDLRNAIAWDHASLDSLPFGRRLQLFVESSDISISLDLVETGIIEHFFPTSLRRRQEALGPDQAIIARYLAEQGKSPVFVFDISNLDSNGDMLNTEGTTIALEGKKTSPMEPASISPYAESVLVPFLEEMKNRQVRVFFDYTPYMLSLKPGEEWKESEVAFSGEIRRIGGELLEQRDAFFYPNSLFFNSYLHLNAQGREKRTQTLIEALRHKLKLPAGS